MDFLVQLETTLPADMPPSDRETLLDRDAARGRELFESGMITGIWLVPGTLANVGVWSAADPDAVHAAIASLPAWPWSTVTVTALATHPLMLD
jgi:muconolactone D-isomerase